ncbi:hypothetical protein Tco_1199930, partial [Tanacetum coccineum]
MNILIRASANTEAAPLYRPITLQLEDWLDRLDSFPEKRMDQKGAGFSISGPGGRRFEALPEGKREWPFLLPSVETEIEDWAFSLFYREAAGVNSVSSSSPCFLPASACALPQKEAHIVTIHRDSCLWLYSNWQRDNGLIPTPMGSVKGKLMNGSEITRYSVSSFRPGCSNEKACVPIYVSRLKPHLSSSAVERPLVYSSTAALAILITEASQSRQYDTLVRLPMDIRLKINLENQS